MGRGALGPPAHLGILTPWLGGGGQLGVDVVKKHTHLVVRQLRDVDDVVDEFGFEALRLRGDTELGIHQGIPAEKGA